MRNVIPDNIVIEKRKKLDKLLSKVFKSKEVACENKPIDTLSEDIALGYAYAVKDSIIRYIGWEPDLLERLKYTTITKIQALLKSKQQKTPKGVKRTVPLVQQFLADELKVPQNYFLFNGWQNTIKDWQSEFVRHENLNASVDWHPQIFDALGTLECDGDSCFGPDMDRWMDAVQLGCGFDFKLPTFVLYGKSKKNIISRCWGFVISTRPLRIFLSNNYSDDNAFCEILHYKPYLEKMTGKKLVKYTGHRDICIPVYLNRDYVILSNRTRSKTEPYINIRKISLCVVCKREDPTENGILCYGCLPKGQMFYCSECGDDTYKGEGDEVINDYPLCRWCVEEYKEREERKKEAERALTEDIII